MLITKFNQLIRNRLLWGIFAVIVCLSFVGAFTQGGGCSGGAGNRGLAGRLAGKEVSANEFALARYFHLGMRPSPLLDPDDEILLRREIWKRIAALREAANMGIAVYDAEIRETIRRDPSFSVNGVFNRDRYSSFLAGQLKVTPELFESYLRQEISLRKIQDLLQSCVWTSPYEMDTRLRNLNDSFVLNYAVIPEETLVPEQDITRPEVERYFQEHTEEFRLPSEISVRYVEFPIEDYLTDAVVDDAAVSEYYDDHLRNYEIDGTNGLSYVPIEQVREEIKDIITKENAVFKAKDAAVSFVMALAPDRYGSSRDMDSAANDFSLAIHTSGFFSAYGDVPGLDVDLSLNQAAFDLQPDDPDNYFSDPILGDDAVYVIASHERLESRIPAFEEVEEEVTRAASENSRQAKLQHSTGQFRTTILDGMKEGMSFSEAIHDQGLNVVTTSPFSVYTEFSGETSTVDHIETIAPEIVSVQEREVAEPIYLENGNVLFAYVAERERGDPVTTELLRPQLTATVDNYRSSVVYEAWLNDVLDRMNLEDYAAPASTDEEDRYPDGDDQN